MGIEDALVFGYRTIVDSSGAEVLRRSRVKFTGTVTDDPTNDQTVVVTGGGGAVIFDGGDPAENARTDRATLQSPIDNTKQGIVNLGSCTGEPTGTGVLCDFGTICGGDGNTVAAGCDYGVCVGGQNNAVRASAGTVCGGVSNVASEILSTVVGGNLNVASGYGSAIVGGSGAVAPRSFQTAFKRDIATSQEATYAVGGQSNNNGSVNLTDGQGSHEFTLENGKAYAINYTALASDVTSTGVAMFKGELLVRCSAGGVATIDVNAPAANSAALLNGKSWGLTFTATGAIIRAAFHGQTSHNVEMYLVFSWIENIIV